MSNIRGVFDVEEAREARESRLARGECFKIFTSSNKLFHGHFLAMARRTRGDDVSRYSFIFNSAFSSQRGGSR